MIRTYLGHEVPVPEVYGWCLDGEETFIYMELIRGSTLEQRWDELSATERSSLCGQLRSMVAALQAMKQSPRESCIGKLPFFSRHMWYIGVLLSRPSDGVDLIGNIVSGPLQDIIFDSLTVGPFPDSSTFNDWFTQPNWAQTPSNQLLNDIHPLRRSLPDDPHLLRPR
jgi:Phosphotransferase enzyme family